MDPRQTVSLHAHRDLGIDQIAELVEQVDRPAIQSRLAGITFTVAVQVLEFLAVNRGRFRHVAEIAMRVDEVRSINHDDVFEILIRSRQRLLEAGLDDFPHRVRADAEACRPAAIR
jgi:hypothetical protein